MKNTSQNITLIINLNTDKQAVSLTDMETGVWQHNRRKHMAGWFENNMSAIREYPFDFD